MGRENQRTTLLKFPCEFDIKVFGVASEEFEKAVITIVKDDIQNLREDAFSTRPSKDGKYMAMTISFTAESQEQIDNLYRSLTANPLILMAI